MVVRSAVESDHDRILAFIARDPIGWVDADTYRRYQTSGSYGIDRIWLAEGDGRLLACAVWYGSPTTDHPLILDCLWVDSDIGAKAALGGAVLRAGHAAFQSSGAQHIPEYHLFLKPAWQNDSENRLEVEWRRVAARSAGLTNELERLRYEWTSDVGLAPPSTRLVFSSQPGDEVFLDVFRRVAVGSLDQETQDTVAAEGLERHAR
ncbi:MAG: GNAT family N-acetyltransferase, partial [Acidobacteria bacterium]